MHNAKSRSHTKKGPGRMAFWRHIVAPTADSHAELARQTLVRRGLDVPIGQAMGLCRLELLTGRTDVSLLAHNSRNERNRSARHA